MKQTGSNLKCFETYLISSPLLLSSLCRSGRVFKHSRSLRCRRMLEYCWKLLLQVSPGILHLCGRLQVYRWVLCRASPRTTIDHCYLLWFIVSGTDEVWDKAVENKKGAASFSFLFPPHFGSSPFVPGTECRKNWNLSNVPAGRI